MMTLEMIRVKLRERIIALDGVIAPNDLADLIAEARKIGLDDDRIARLMPEADQSINWAQIRAEKAAAAAAAEQLRQAAEARRQQLSDNRAHLNALLSLAFNDGVMTRQELADIFDRAEALGHKPSRLASKIKKALDSRRFRPYPEPDLKRSGLDQVLMSSDWYSEEAYSHLRERQQKENAHPPVHNAPAAPAYNARPVPAIRYFSSDRQVIRKGETVTLSWSVSGVPGITIVPFGMTQKLTGQHKDQPRKDTIYKLTAGSLEREISVRVIPAGTARWFLRKDLLLLVIAFAVSLTVLAFLLRPAGGPSAEPPVAVMPRLFAADKVDAAGLTLQERSDFIRTMDDYLSLQQSSDTSAGAVHKLCQLYSYPVARYYRLVNATNDQVYRDIVSYRSKFRPDGWLIDSIRVRRSDDLHYTAEVAGTFSYQIRRSRKGDGRRSCYLRNRYELDRNFRIRSVYTADQRFRGQPRSY